MYDDLRIILYPDPRLKKVSAPVEVFDENLRQLAERMLQLMREHRGVGLAAPQVGQNVRVFVINPTGQPQDDRIYVNPVLSEAEGDEEDEEGCLSLPGITTRIWRNKKVKMQAQDLEGRPFEQVESGYVPRIWQHELDHLNGTLLLDRMGQVAKIANRRVLRDLEERYAKEHPGEPAKLKRKA